MKYIADYKQTIKTSNLAQEDKNKILSALDFAISAHSGQTRKSGEAYIIHPIAVSQRLWELYGDIDLAIAGLLHDVVEDCKSIQIEELYKKFGQNVGFLCDATNKQERGFYANSESFEDKLERLLWAGMQDVRVLLLKIADREHNLGTIQHLKNNKQVRMSFETQAIYQPLREVLQYSKISISEATNKLSDLLDSSNINAPADLKNLLYTNRFKNFSHKLFDIAYRNSSNIIWKMDSIADYRRLLEESDIANACKLISIESIVDKTYVNFSFLSNFALADCQIEASNNIEFEI